MSTYLYRHDECSRDLLVVHGMTEDPEIPCPECAQPMRRVILPGRAAAKIKNDGEGYQPCLARRPGDPEAFCDGPRAVKKLLDKRKRQAEARGGHLTEGLPNCNGAREKRETPSFAEFIQKEEG